MRSRSLGAYLGESMVARQLSAIQDAHPDVDIGSYPFQDTRGYGTTLVVRGVDEQRLEIVIEEIRTMIVSAGTEPLERS